MEILNKDDFPIIGCDPETVRIALNHQNILRDIRIKANKINLDNANTDELLKFVEFCKEKTE